MSAYTIDPIKDERWGEFLKTHPAASVFHTPDWLEALRRTYGYEPVVFTTSASGHPLTNGIPFCRIIHWFSGRRLVSLPFSDHCAPLAQGSEQLAGLLACLRDGFNLEKCKRMEIRVLDSVLPICDAFEKGQVFFLHKLDLSPQLDDIYQNFHSGCVQRKIQRATREQLTYDEGRSEPLLKQFYGLLLMTRRRHGLPPQPFAWFQNLVACLGVKLKIRIASKDGRPVAGILTLQYKQTLVYKYGCSDERFNRLGGIQMLLWKAIEEAKKEQLSEFDMGRSDCDNTGLITFKDRWGATRTRLIYLQYPRDRFRSIRHATQGNLSKRFFAHMPTSLLSTAGRILYKYMG